MSNLFLFKMSKITSICRIVSFSYVHLKKLNASQYPLLVRRNLPQLESVRCFAKGKDKKKEDKGKKVKRNIQLNEAFLEEVLNLEKLNTEMEQNVRKLNDSFMKYVTIRTSLGSIENVPVSFEGKRYSLIELGQVVRKNPKVVAVNMKSFPQAISATLKALSESGMNLNPQQEGTTIYVPVPRITREYREELVKNAKALFIKCRDGVRDVQNKCLKSLKSKEKQGDISEDDCIEASEQVKFIGDTYIVKAQKLLEAKQIELLGVKDEN